MTDDKKKRRFRFFDDDFPPFDDVEELLKKEIERMMKFVNDLLQNMEISPGKPIVYGFRVTIGPDGIPRIQTFGNVKQGVPIKTEEVFEPTVDIIEEEDKVRVIVEIPGADKDTIRVKASERAIYVEAKGERSYAKRIKLPVEIDPKSAKAKFKNGILEIIVSKKGKKEEFDVKVE